MPKKDQYLVHLDDHMLRNGIKKMTANQWLASTRIYKKSERLSDSPIWRLGEAITVWLSDSDGQPLRRIICKKVSELFSVIDRKCTVKDIIVRMRWKSGEIGPHGLFVLNSARRQPAFRKDGYNIICTLGHDGPRMRNDFFDVLAALEIRPVFRGKTPKPGTPSLPHKIVKAAATLNIMSNPTKDITKSRFGGKKPPRVRPS